MQKENQDIIIAIIAASFLMLLFCTLTFIVILNTMKRKRALILENEMQAASFKQQLMEAQLEMQEHTFRIVSQEIHDNVGQILSLTKLNLNIITAQQKENEAFLHIKELVAEAISELRDLSQGYYADKLAKEGLVNAVRHLLDQHTRTGLFSTSFYSDIDEVTLDKSHVIFVYRMVQESLNNVVKHANATEVQVRILDKEEWIRIEITDNGKGFDVAAPGFRQGIGLSSITQRAAMIGAEALIDTRPGSGTRIILSIKA